MRPTCAPAHATDVPNPGRGVFALALAWALLLVAAPVHAAVSKPLPGVTLARNANSALAVVDLCAPGVSLRATRYAERRATAQAWATRADVQAQLAINADFFDLGVWSYVVSRARGAGEDWPQGTQLRERRQYWQFGPRIAALERDAFVAPQPGVTEVVGSHNVLISNGQSLGPNFDGDAVLKSGARRTAVGLSQDRRTLFLFASNASLVGTGIVSELVALAQEAGAPPIWEATNMDGGGSTQLYVQGLGNVIASTRQLGNHLGVRATGNGAPTHCPSFPFQAEYVGAGFPGGTELTLASGTTASGWMDLRNTGTQTWQPGVTHLGTTGPRDMASPLATGSWPGPNRLATVSAPTPPGAVGRFAFDVRAPVTPGKYVQTFNVVQDGVAWFSDSGGPADHVLSLSVTSVVPPFRAELAEDWPGGRVLTLAPGAKAEGAFSFRNTGAETWTPGKTLVGTQQPQDGASPLYAEGWPSPGRAATVEASTPPGAVGRFRFAVEAPPEPGTYRQHFGLLEEGVTWFHGVPPGGADGLWLEVQVSPPEQTVPPAGERPPSDEAPLPGEDDALLPGAPPSPAGDGSATVGTRSTSARGGCAATGAGSGTLPFLWALAAVLARRGRRRR